MNKRCLKFFLFIIFSLCSYTQLRSGTHSYDAINYKLNFDIYNCFLFPFPASFTAKEEITLTALTALNSINLNARNESIEIISVSDAEGKPLGSSHNLDILNIILGKEYSAGETINIIIDYKHKDVVDSAFYVDKGIVYTDSQPEGARCWYPCWDKPNDKATFVITAKVPLSVML